MSYWTSWRLRGLPGRGGSAQGGASAGVAAWLAGAARSPANETAFDEAASGHDGGEAALVERLKAYDEGAVRQVYRRYADAIYRYALYQGGDPILAEDVTGEAFVRLMESIGSYTYRGAPLSAWLYRTARNLVIDHQRRGRRVKPLDEVQQARFTSDDPVDLAEKRLDGEELRSALGELTDEQRQVIVLKFVENLQNHEVAEIVGKNEGSVKSLQHRALRSLRRVLEKRGHRA